MKTPFILPTNLGWLTVLLGQTLLLGQQDNPPSIPLDDQPLKPMPEMTNQHEILSRVPSSCLIRLQKIINLLETTEHKQLMSAIRVLLELRVLEELPEQIDQAVPEGYESDFSVVLHDGIPVILRVLAPVVEMD